MPTLFNQLNAAGLTWKDYDQDLGGAQNYEQDAGAPFAADTVPGRDDAACGGPGTSSNNPTTDPLNLVAPSGDVASYTGAQNAKVSGQDYIDQYVAKHNPAPWFESFTGEVDSSGSTPPLNEPANGGTNCDAQHVVNLDSPTTGLVSDLVHNTVPAFSWITPDNCSDAHDAVCKGDNLSGAFNANGTPNYQTGTATAYDPETIPPTNYTGGLYASDLFLRYYIPLIEQSRAFRDGGLIDITFDEGNPPFTYSGNSFNNANAYAAPTPHRTSRTPVRASPADTAGENYSDGTSTQSRRVPTRRCRPTTRATSSTRGRVTTASSTGRRPAPRPARSRRQTACRGSSEVDRARRRGRASTVERLAMHRPASFRTAPSWPMTPDAA